MMHAVDLGYLEMIKWLVQNGFLGILKMLFDCEGNS